MKQMLTVGLVFLIAAANAWAAGTVTHVMRVLPAPEKVEIDGQTADWDLRAGMLICGDIDNQLNTHSLWVHAMHDETYLYLLVRWRDETPLNNPRGLDDEQGWLGDALQFRLWERKDQQDAITHMDGWQAPNGKDRINLSYGRDLNQKHIRRAKEHGAKQAFRLVAPSFYVQEIALPWKLLSLDGKRPTAASVLKATVQGNFSQPSGKEIPIGDLLGQGQQWNLNGVFKHPEWWGEFVLVDGAERKSPPVVLTDGQQYETDHSTGYPVVDWRGRVQALPALGVLTGTDVPPEIRDAVLANLQILRTGNSQARRDAMKALRGLGPKAFPILHDSLKDPDPEVGFSAREILYGR